MSKLVVYAAGSLRYAFSALLSAFSRRTGVPVSGEFGPAGVLRRRIERGERPHLFASADMAHPQRLVELGIATALRPFAGNRLCVTVRNMPALTETPLLAVLCDARWRLATSTPGDDPGGDYALELFSLIERERPGQGKMLSRRAQALVGGKTSEPLPAGRMAAEFLLTENRADIFLGYASYASALATYPQLCVRALPGSLTVRARYGCCLLTEEPAALALQQFIGSQEGQRLLRSHGFEIQGY